MQVYVIFNVKVGAPMADFGRPLQLRNFDHWMVITIMYHDVFLLVMDELLRRGRRNVMIRTISYRRTRFCHRRFHGEFIEVLWNGVRVDLG